MKSIVFAHHINMTRARLTKYNQALLLLASQAAIFFALAYMFMKTTR